MTVILEEKNLSLLIRSTRKKAGLSQIELAELAGVGKTLIFNLENGQANVQFTNLLKVLRVLNIKISVETF
jgi:HTH-type transcriptional regulator / antitoxin HipB